MTAAPKRVELVFEVPWTHPSWVLEDEKMPESALQDAVCDALASSLRAWSKRVGRAAMVRRNLAVRWDEDHPRIGVDPDVCLLIPPPATPESKLRSLRTWEEGNAPPLVAIEVVSAEMPRKDYELGPRKCGAAGVGELWVFDPQRLGPRDDGGPWALQVWARGRRGEFRRVYAGDGPARSDALDAWVVVTEGGSRLRVSDDEQGERLWPTEAEEARAAEAERDAMKAKIAELEALLAKGGAR